MVAGLAGESVPALQGLPPGSTIHYLVQQPGLGGGREGQEVMQEREARRRVEQELVREKRARNTGEEELKQEKEARRRGEEELVQELALEKEARRKGGQELVRERESRRRAEKDLLKEREERRRRGEDSLKDKEKRKQVEQLLVKEKGERRKEVALEKEAKLEVEEKLNQEKNGKRKLNLKLYEERTLLRKKACKELEAEKEKRRMAESKVTQHKEDKRKLELKLHEDGLIRSKVEKALKAEKEKRQDLEIKLAIEKNKRLRAEDEYVKKKVELNSLKAVKNKFNLAEKVNRKQDNLDDSGIETKDEASPTLPTPRLPALPHLTFPSPGPAGAAARPSEEQDSSYFKFSRKATGSASPFFLAALSEGQTSSSGDSPLFTIGAGAPPPRPVGAPLLFQAGAPQLFQAGAAPPCPAAAGAPPLFQAEAGSPCPAGAPLLYPAAASRHCPTGAGAPYFYPAAAGAASLFATGSPPLYLCGAGAPPPCPAAAGSPPPCHAAAGSPPSCPAAAGAPPLFQARLGACLPCTDGAGAPPLYPAAAGAHPLYPAAAGAPPPRPAGAAAATVPWPRPHGPPGPRIDCSLNPVLHFASQSQTVSEFMSDASEDYTHAEDDHVEEEEHMEDANKLQKQKLKEDPVPDFMSSDSEDVGNNEDLIEEEEYVQEKKKPKKPKEKKPKKPKEKKYSVKVKPVPLEGPYVLDEVKLEEDLKNSPEHVKVIKNFPRLNFEIFNPVDKRIPASKNIVFLNLLFNSQDAEETLAAYQLTRESYELKYGEKFVAVDVQPTHGATGGRGKDTIQTGIKNVKSEVWVNSITTIFNMLIDFVQDKQEFRFINWFVATAAEIDIILGHFLIWLAPQEGGGSLGGTRYTTRTLKQIKTKMQNLLKHLLKRSDIDINSPSFCFTQNMYAMKRNKTAEEPMEGLEGDRERKAFEEEDKVKLDLWRTLPLDQVC